MSLHVAILMGGCSVERDVSLISGRACARALRTLGYQVSEIDVIDGLWTQFQTMRPDIVFNALHGAWGEDGRVQGLLDMSGIAYTHSGVMASALAMDKHRSKAILQQAGINVPKGRLGTARDVYAEPLARPYVIKPNAQGSSVGVHIIRDDTHALPDLGDTDDLFVIEAFIPGRELTVTVLGDKALAVTEIIARTGWYDYQAKYAEGGSEHILPASISPAARALCLDWALLAHQALGCRGVSRVDFRLDDTGLAQQAGRCELVKKLSVLELNTQPGMTPTSLVPEQAAYCGMDFAQLCRWIVEDASCPR